MISLVRHGETIWNAKETRKIFFECGSPGDPNRRVFLFDTFKKLFRHLTSGECDEIWKVLESAPCAGRLSPIEKGYVSLFKAVGRRDGGGMASASQFLLEAEPDITPERMHYVLAAGMLGLLSQSRWGDAERLWSTYEPRVSGAASKSFVLRVLEAEMFAGRRDGTSSPSLPRSRG